MAYHGGLLNIPVTVVVPVFAPIMKIENCKRYGAKVIIHGVNMGESRDLGLRMAREQGLLYVNGWATFERAEAIEKQILCMYL